MMALSNDDTVTLTSLLRKIIREEITQAMLDMPAAVDDAICNMLHNHTETSTCDKHAHTHS